MWRPTPQRFSAIHLLASLMATTNTFGFLLSLGVAAEQARLIVPTSSRSTLSPASASLATTDQPTSSHYADPLQVVSKAFCHVSPLSFAGSLLDLCDSCHSQHDAMSKMAGTSAPASLATSAQDTDPSMYSIAYEVNRPTRVLPEQEKLQACTITLVKHSFQNSYGKPAIAQYSPSSFETPCKDPSKWVFVEMGIHASGKGRQFDRLGSVQFDGIEVLRTDNAEPKADGTQWSFTKEMNKYFDVFRTDRTLVFDLPNIVNEKYVSPLDYTLTLTAYVPSAGSTTTRKPLSQDFAVILPLSKQSKTENSFFSIGEEENSSKNGVTSLKIPQNARSAIVEIYASGTAQDEFWYTNLPDSAFSQDGGEAYNYGYGRGPLREVQVLIDGKLAGIAQPYPVLFTGGISPFLWRPQVAYGAFDQPTYYVDVTPFLGELTDGQAHDFTLDVVSAEKNQSVLQWFVSGNVQVQLDSSNERTTGKITSYSAPISYPYEVEAIVSGKVSQDGFIKAHVQTNPAQRIIKIEASIKTGSSQQPYAVTWLQNVSYSNDNRIQGDNAETVQKASGTSQSMHGGQIFLSNEFDFDFNTGSQSTDMTISHTYLQSLHLGQSASNTYKEPTLQRITMRQEGKAHNIMNGTDLIGGTGTMYTDYAYEDDAQVSFSRKNSATEQGVTQDEVAGSLASKAGRVR